ncbi:MAG: hypothetical protein R2880_07545 [Deinococcales bacterium]
MKSYRIIYELIDDVKRMIRGQIEPEYEEKVMGHAEVRMVISIPKQGNIGGSYITDGCLSWGAGKLTRKSNESGSVAQLKPL